MRTYSVRTGCIAPETLSMFSRLVEDFHAIPDLDPVDKVGSQTTTSPDHSSVGCCSQQNSLPFRLEQRIELI